MLLIVWVYRRKLLISIVCDSVRFKNCARWSCCGGYCISFMMMSTFCFFLRVWLNRTRWVHTVVPRIHIRQVALACDT